MNIANKTRRLARAYLAAVDRVLLALDQARKLRAALRRQVAAEQRKRRGRETIIQ
jgi:hypothetical protein